MSTISSLTLLNKFNVRDVRGLEEKVVDVGVNEIWWLSIYGPSINKDKYYLYIQVTF